MKRNPIVPRVRHVEKTYGVYPAYKAISAWAEATGDHLLGIQAEQAYGEGGDSFVDVVEKAIKRHPELKSTRFDRYVPWAAQAIRSEERETLKAVNADPGSKLVGVPIKRWKSIAEFDPFALNLSDATMSLLSRLDGLSDTLVKRFRSVVDWAEATGTDPGSMELDDVLAEAESWSLGHEGEAIEGEVVYRFPDGWTVQKLTTEEQLKAEGDTMQHCVGTYCPVTDFCPDCEQAHGHVLGSDALDVDIYSLRDPNGKPHATMEWDIYNKFVVQLRGKQNDMPKAEYLRPMVCFRLEYLQPYLLRPALTKMRQTLSPTAAVLEEDLGGAQSYILDPDAGRQFGLQSESKVRAALGSLSPLTITLLETDPGHVMAFTDETLELAAREIGDTSSRYRADLLPYALPLHDELAFPIWLDTAQMLVRLGRRKLQDPQDTDDEMVEALAYYDWETVEGYIGREACKLGSRAANPRRGRARTGASMSDLKRKLLR